MKSKLVILGLLGLVCGILCLGSYHWGKMNVRLQVVIQEKEVIKYVEKQRKVIYSQPHAHRDELIKRMHAGQL